MSDERTTGDNTHEFTMRFRVIDEAKLRAVYAELCGYADLTDMDLTDPADIGIELVYNLDTITDMRRERGHVGYTGWDDLGLER